MKIQRKKHTRSGDAIETADRLRSPAGGSHYTALTSDPKGSSSKGARFTSYASTERLLVVPAAFLEAVAQISSQDSCWWTQEGQLVLEPALALSFVTFANFLVDNPKVMPPVEVAEVVEPELEVSEPEDA